MFAIGEKAYVNAVVEEMIDRIRSAPEDQSPLLTIRHFIYWIDYFGRSDGASFGHPVKNNKVQNEFIKNVVWICNNLEQYLGDNEEEQQSV